MRGLHKADPAVDGLGLKLKTTGIRDIEIPIVTK